MAAFIGKWKQDEFDPKDMTDFFNAAGKTSFILLYFILAFI